VAAFERVLTQEVADGDPQLIESFWISSEHGSPKPHYCC
jgi:hypothetical protein